MDKTVRMRSCRGCRSPSIAEQPHARATEEPRRRWQLFAGDEVPEGSGGLGLIPREAGCADPVFEEVVRVAALWDKDSNVGWYLYRLAAIDPTM